MHDSVLWSARLAASVLVPPLRFLESQSVKSDSHGSAVGYDAGKNIKGRKRHLLVDTLGLVLGVLVTAANVPEREGGQTLLGRTLKWFAWLRLLWVDGGYSGPDFAQGVRGLSPKARQMRLTACRDKPQRWAIVRVLQ